MPVVCVLPAADRLDDAQEQKKLLLENEFAAVPGRWRLDISRPLDRAYFDLTLQLPSGATLTQRVLSEEWELGQARTFLQSAFRAQGLIPHENEPGERELPEGSAALAR